LGALCQYHPIGHRRQLLVVTNFMELNPFEKLVVAQLVKKFFAFMEPKFHCHARFDIFAVIKIEVVVFWVIDVIQ
jgi:hypothetical protein